MAKQTEVSSATNTRAAQSLHPLLSLRQDIDRVFDSAFTGWPGHNTWPSFGSLRTFNGPGTVLSPDIDVSEADGEYRITVELPGIDEKDIEVTVAENVLTLKGEKKEEHEAKKKNYVLTERSYGSFQRAFTLPADVDDENISTEFSKGVLTVVVPKSPEAKAKTRKIEVKAA